MDGLRAVLQIRGKLAFRPPCGSPVTVIVMRAWLAVTGVPPVYMDEIMTIRTVLPF